MTRTIERTTLAGRWLRSLLAIAFVGLQVGATTVIPATTAQAGGASIEFLNPSSFSARPGVGIIVSSTKPSRPQAGTSTYRISAWTTTVPTNGGVEFELLKSGVSLETMDTTISDTGFNTYESDWAIPATLPDGDYTLRATLFENNEAIDTTDQDIVILRTAERAEITYPSTTGSAPFPLDGSFGTYAALAQEKPDEGAPVKRDPIGNIESNNTGASPGTGTSFVRTFYTVSAPGTSPDWQACGTEKAPGETQFFSTAAHNGVRCTLKNPAHQTLVTAVAAVANTSQGSFDPAFNQAGDAQRVTEAYAQVPTNLSLAEGSTGVQISQNEDDTWACHYATVHLDDQRGREILGANIDVHASGPNDKFKFETGLLATEISGFQAPDQHVDALEPGYDCASGSESGETNGLQGEHQMLGAPDVKHIESDGTGTEDTGNWTFGIWTPTASVSAENFTARFTAWVDELDGGCIVNDDIFGDGELSASGIVGYGAMPGGPEPFASRPIDDCVAPPPDTPAVRQVTLTPDSPEILTGTKAQLSGSITSEKQDCVSEQTVKIKKRGRAGRFFTLLTTTTSADGFFSAEAKAREGRNRYKAVAPANEACQKARSEVVVVRAHNELGGS